jgi:hypothetical protein
VSSFSIVGRGPHPNEEQGNSPTIGVSLSDDILDRVAKPNAAANWINSDSLTKFFRELVVFLIFRPNLLGLCGIGFGPIGDSHLILRTLGYGAFKKNCNFILKFMLAKEKALVTTWPAFLYFFSPTPV